MALAIAAIAFAAGIMSITTHIGPVPVDGGKKWVAKVGES